MARKSKSAKAGREIHYLRIDPMDVDINWLHSMRTPEEKDRDEEVAEWFKKRLIPYHSKRKKLQRED
jgi:hypothetical protein